MSPLCRILQRGSGRSPMMLQVGFLNTHTTRWVVLTADDTRTYTWDLASRLTAYTEGGSTVSFAYDGMRMRTGRTQGGVTRTYVWNYALGLPSVSVVRGAEGDIRYYIHLPDGRLLHSIETSDNTRRFYHFDEMGTTLYLSNDAGTITDSYGISPYGEFTAKTGTTNNPFTFIGAYGVMREGISGLYYMRERYYGSDTGRFLTRDPVRTIEPRSLSPYQYALGNPMRFIDPMGTFPSWDDVVDTVAGWLGIEPDPPPPQPSWWNTPGGFNQSGESALSYPKGGEKAPPMSLHQNSVPFIAILVPTIVGGMICSPVSEFGIILALILWPIYPTGEVWAPWDGLDVFIDDPINPFKEVEQYSEDDYYDYYYDHDLYYDSELGSVTLDEGEGASVEFPSGGAKKE